MDCHINPLFTRSPHSVPWLFPHLLNYWEVANHCCCGSTCYLWPASSTSSFWFKVDTPFQLTAGWSWLWSSWKDRRPGSRCVCCTAGRCSGSPAAFDTRFGRVLAGSTSNMMCILSSHHSVPSFHSQLVASGDKLFCKFWELEARSVLISLLKNAPSCNISKKITLVLKMEVLLCHYPRILKQSLLAKSRSQAIRRFLSLECSLHARNQF